MNARRFVPGLILVVALAPLAPAQDRETFYKSNKQLMAALAEVVARPSEFTVRVRCDDKDVALGTVVDPDGWVLTKASELKGETKVKLKDDREFAARLVGLHKDHDLALLKIEATNLAVPEWRASKEDAVGSWVATPGPGKEPVAVGVISVAARTITGRAGPQFMPTANSGYLGVQMEPAKEGGVKIKDVLKDTAAEKAGLKVGDLVRSIDDKEVPDVDTMMETLARKKVGDKVTVRVVRDGKPLDLQATLGKRPGGFNRNEFQNTMGGPLSERRSGFKSVLLHDTVLKPNECGGPLVDLDGKVVGINIARASRVESIAIPTETLRPLIAELKAGKYPPPKVDQATLDKVKQLRETIRKLKDDHAASEKKLKEAEEELKKLEEKK